MKEEELLHPPHIMDNYKYDKTRLINLLRNYRDHMITRYNEKLPHVGIVRCIEEIDEAIKTIKFCI